MSKHFDPSIFEKEARDAPYDVPPHTLESLIRWVNYGTPGGSFLTHVLNNELVQSFDKADSFNSSNMQSIAAFLYNVMPPASYGSREATRIWMQHRGRSGIDTKGPTHGEDHAN
jgi:hypothetical protein